MKVNWKDVKNFFIGNPSAYAKQWDNGLGYKAIKGRVTKDLLQQHINQQITLGFYCGYNMNNVWYCKWLCLDIDNHDGLIPADELEEKTNKIYQFLITFYSIPLNVICKESSGSGYHIWIKLAHLTTLNRAYLVKVNMEERIEREFKMKFEINPKKEAIKEDGLGNLVKIPFSIHRKYNKECKLLDGFDLSKQGTGWNINELASKLSIENAKKVERKKYLKEKAPKVDYSKWKAINAPDKHFYDQLDLCLLDIVNGKKSTHGCEGSNGHDMNIALINKLFSINAPFETRVNAMRTHTKFNEEKTKYQVQSLEDSCIESSLAFVSSCKTIYKRGFCNLDCPYTYRLNGLLPKAKVQERNGLKGGFDELNNLFEEDMDKPKNKQFCEKTTRSGTTTSIIKTAIDKHKKILVIAPTINIFKITVKEAIELSNETPKIFRIGSNSELCFQVKEKLINFKVLNDFPFMLKGKCDVCKHKNLKGDDRCNWRKAVEDIDKFDLIYLTTAKIFYMLKSNDPDVKAVLDKIFNTVDVIFLDEISSVLNVGEEGFIFRAIANPMYTKKYIETDFYLQFFNELDAMGDWLINNLTSNEVLLWESLISLIEGVKKKNELYLKNRETSFVRIISPLFTMIKKLDDKFRLQKQRKSGVGVWLNIYQKLQKYSQATGIMPKAVVQLFIFALNDYFYIQYTNPDGYDIRSELIPGKPIMEFLDKLNYISEKKKFYCTDATAPLLKVDKMFKNITKLIINDPNNTAAIQKVIPYPHTINLSKFGFVRTKLPEIIAYCIEYGNPNTMIICQNKQIYYELKKTLQKGINYDELTYFRSGLTIGTPSDCRTIITIGSPYPPKNSHRCVADHFLREGLVDKSKYNINSLTKYLELYNAKSYFFQAISRGKDPQGITPSKVYCYGLNRSQVQKLLDFNIATPEIIEEVV